MLAIQEFLSTHDWEETPPTLWGRNDDGGWDRITNFTNPYDAIPFTVLLSERTEAMLVMFGWASEYNLDTAEATGAKKRCRVMLYMSPSLIDERYAFGVQFIGEDTCVEDSQDMGGEFCTMVNRHLEFMQLSGQERYMRLLKAIFDESDNGDDVLRKFPTEITVEDDGWANWDN